VEGSYIVSLWLYMKSGFLGEEGDFDKEPGIVVMSAVQEAGNGDRKEPGGWIV